MSSHSWIFCAFNKKWTIWPQICTYSCTLYLPHYKGFAEISCPGIIIILWLFCDKSVIGKLNWWHWQLLIASCLLPLESLDCKNQADTCIFFSPHVFFCVGNPNGQTSFQGYQGQHFPEPTQWSGNMEQQNYPQQTINGFEMMNSHQPMGVRREEAVYNPRGPGRGGMIHYLPSKACHWFYCQAKDILGTRSFCDRSPWQTALCASVLPKF